jgi:hypothetical protein
MTPDRIFENQPDSNNDYCEAYYDYCRNCNNFDIVKAFMIRWSDAYPFNHDVIENGARLAIDRNYLESLKAIYHEAIVHTCPSFTEDIRQYAIQHNADEIAEFLRIEAERRDEEED